MSDDVALRMRPGAGTHRCHWKIPTDLASTRENRSEIVMVAMTDEDPEGVQLPNGTQAPEGVERAEQTSEPEEAQAPEGVERAEQASEPEEGQAPEGVERAEGEDEPEEDDDEPRLFPGDIKLDPNRFPRGTLYGWLPDPAFDPESGEAQYPLPMTFKLPWLHGKLEDNSFDVLLLDVTIEVFSPGEHP